MPTLLDQINNSKSKYPDGNTWTAGEPSATNISLGTVSVTGIGIGASIIGSLSGVPQVTQITNSLLNLTPPSLTSTYTTLEKSQFKPVPGVQYSDFRSRLILQNTLQNSTKIRLDGASATLRGSKRAAIYAAAAASPAGAYSIFNLDGSGKSGFGWGDHGNRYALRNDFTLGSHVRTVWKNNQWERTGNPVERVTAFRGDRVNVIDFSKRTIDNAYQWQAGGFLDNIGALGAINGNITQDFIKFFFTGPKLQNGAPAETEDDIIVFRAAITSLSDTFSPTWTAQTMIGRADPNHHYTGVTRDINLDFNIYATDRDEVKPIWRKLNALAGYTAPEYDTETIALKAPWMRITIGDLFRQQAAIITSLTYTLHDSDSTWEINIEQDPTMMQVPHKVSVSIGMTLVPDYLPQKGGRFYTLSSGNKFDFKGEPIPGNGDWMSDSKRNPISQYETQQVNKLLNILLR